MKRTSTLAIAICLAGAGATLAAAAASSPQALLSSILAAGRAQHAVHYVSDARLGTTHVIQVTDVAATEGIQRITYVKAGQSGHVTVIVSGRNAYVRGDAFALVNYMGFKPAASAKYANVWIKIPASDPAYPRVAADVTLASAIDTLKGPGRPLAAPRKTIGGQRMAGVEWRTRVGGKIVVITLYARASGKPLPVQERATRGNGVFSVTFNRWNLALNVALPSSAVAIGTTDLE
jgi:hypothetical protein